MFKSSLNTSNIFYNERSLKMENQEVKKDRKSFQLYLDKEMRMKMKIKEVLTGIKYQDKIRNFIKEDLKNEKN